MPTILSSSSSDTTVNLAWTQASGDNVTSFTISHTFDVIGCAGVGGNNMDTITAESARTSDSTYEYVLTRLEENSRVVVTITATNSAGTSPGATVTRDTLEASTCVIQLHILRVRHFLVYRAKGKDQQRICAGIGPCCMDVFCVAGFHFLYSNQSV